MSKDIDRDSSSMSRRGPRDFKRNTERTTHRGFIVVRSLKIVVVKTDKTLKNIYFNMSYM